MQTSDIIFFAVSIIGSLGTMCFVFIAFSYAQHLKKDSIAIRKLLDRMLFLVMGDHIRNNFNEVNELKKTFSDLVNREQYEEAENLKMVISKAAENAERSLHNFKEIFGDDACEIIVSDVKKNSDS